MRVIYEAFEAGQLVKKSCIGEKKTVKMSFKRDMVILIKPGGLPKCCVRALDKNAPKISCKTHYMKQLSNYTTFH